MYVSSVNIKPTICEFPSMLVVLAVRPLRACSQYVRDEIICSQTERHASMSAVWEDPTRLRRTLTQLRHCARTVQRKRWFRLRSVRSWRKRSRGASSCDAGSWYTNYKVYTYNSRIYIYIFILVLGILFDHMYIYICIWVFVFFIFLFVDDVYC